MWRTSRCGLALVLVAIASFRLSAVALQAGEGALGSVTLEAPAPAGGVVVTLKSSRSFVSVPASVTVKEGETVATFTLMTKSGGKPGTATITAVLPSAPKSPKTATIAVRKPADGPPPAQGD